MAPEKHSNLGASSAYRWINCPPSAALCAAVKDIPSPYALEGTQAHAVCEHLLRKALGIPEGSLSIKCDSEMMDAAKGYRNYVLEQIKANYETTPVVCVEARVNYDQWAPGGYGTVDCLVVGDHRMMVFDYKYGQGVEVDADWNPQMMCYALGGLDMFGMLFEIYDIDLTIYQPRRSHISTFHMTTDELLRWAKDTLEPAAKLAAAGEGEMATGEWCRFCKVKSTCKALADQSMELAKLDFADPLMLSNKEISALLPKLELMIDWAKTIKDYALEQALTGEKFPGYKLVEGRSNRRFISETDACLKIKEAGYDPYRVEMKGLTELQKEMGKKTFDEVCGKLLEKPAGKPALVPVTDKRPELNLSAQADFAN